MSLLTRLDKLEARWDAFAGRNGVVLILPVKLDSGRPEGSKVVIRIDGNRRLRKNGF